MAKTPSPSPPLPAVAHAVLPLCRGHAAHQGLPAAPRDLCEQGTEAARLCAEGFQSFFLSSFSRGNDSVVRSVSKVFRLDHPAAKKSRAVVHAIDDILRPRAAERTPTIASRRPDATTIAAPVGRSIR